MNSIKKQALLDLCDKMDVNDLDLELLQQALTHTSYAYENKGSIHNERLEFLGDAVLELIVSTLLFEKYSDKNEGDLTRARANLVCEASLSEKARKLDLGSYLRLGRGEKKSGGDKRASVLADAFEACLGAVYVSKGLSVARVWVEKMFHADIECCIEASGSLDYKTKLQELVYSKNATVEEKIAVIKIDNGELLQERIAYLIEKETGPEHEKKFWVKVSVDGRILGEGMGRNKKEAEQLAAKRALLLLDV